jgi:hypothetical protein
LDITLTIQVSLYPLLTEGTARSLLWVRRREADINPAAPSRVCHEAVPKTAVEVFLSMEAPPYMPNAAHFYLN